MGNLWATYDRSTYHCALLADLDTLSADYSATSDGQHVTSLVFERCSLSAIPRAITLRCGGIHTSKKIAGGYQRICLGCQRHLPPISTKLESLYAMCARCRTDCAYLFHSDQITWQKQWLWRQSLLATNKDTTQLVLCIWCELILLPPKTNFGYWLGFFFAGRKLNQVAAIIMAGQRISYDRSAYQNALIASLDKRGVDYGCRMQDTTTMLMIDKGSSTMAPKAILLRCNKFLAYVRGVANIALPICLACDCPNIYMATVPFCLACQEDHKYLCESDPENWRKQWLCKQIITNKDVMSYILGIWCELVALPPEKPDVGSRGWYQQGKFNRDNAVDRIPPKPWRR